MTANPNSHSGNSRGAISIRNVSKVYDPGGVNVRAVDDCSLEIAGGEVCMIVGPSGCGKTTLLRIIAGLEYPDRGGKILFDEDDVTTLPVERRKVGMVFQSYALFPNMSVKANIGYGLKMQKLPKIDIEARVSEVLEMCQLNDHSERAVTALSGGQRQRVALARAIAPRPRLLLLDEPTNHLDLKTTLWLEQWLKRYKGMLLVISHDRTFLDAVINGIISIENLNLVQYSGSFSDFERQKAEKMALEKKLLDKQNKRRSEIESFVKRFSAKASKARQARSRIKELERMQSITAAYIDSQFNFRFFSIDSSSGYLIQADSLQVGYESVVVDKVTINISESSRIGFLGKNGSGKSTLLKVLARRMQKLGGRLAVSKKTKAGFFGQHQIDELEADMSPLEIIQEVNIKKTSQEIRNFLGGFGFMGQRVDDQVCNFSGGEKARLALARLVWMKPNLLLLDEPTNHLDLEMIQATTTALQSFNGAVIVVSHNRHLLSATVDELYLIHEGGFSPYEGDLNDYEIWLRKSFDKKDQQQNTITKENFKKAERKNSAVLRLQTGIERKEIKTVEIDLEKTVEEIAKLDDKMSEAAL